MALKEFTLANFYSGLSENHYFGAEKGQFQYAENVDCQAEPRGMRLTASQETDISSFNGTTGDCTLMQRLEDWFPNYSGWIHVISDTLYYNGSFVASLSTGVKGWAPYFSGSTPYVYIFSASKVDQYMVGGSVTLATATFSVNTSGYRPWIQRAGDVLFGAGDKVYKISGIGGATSLSVELDFNYKEEITAMTKFSSQYNIYTKTGIEGGGKQFGWDGSTSSVLSTIIWDNCAPIAAVSAGAFDYVLAGKNESFTDLYIATGNDRKIVRSGLVGGKGKRFFPRMKMCKDILYIMGSIDITKKGETANRKSCIFSYGAENAGFPKGMQIETILPTVATEEQAYNNLYPSEDYLYFVQGTTSTTPDKQYKVQKRRDINVDYISTGNWISNTLTGGVIWTKKQLKMMAISYSLDNTLGYGGSISVYMRNKTYGDFTLVTTITDDTQSFVKIYENELTDAINIFHELEVKFVLNADVTGEFSPMLYEATIIYEDNLKS